MAKPFLVIFEEPSAGFTTRRFATRAEAASAAISYSLPARVFEIVREIRPRLPTLNG